MKNTSIIFIVWLSICSISKAQTTDDAMRFNQRKVTGTARSMAMANAFGALGGDLSSLSINPAGIAVYRTSEFAFTPSLSFNSIAADYQNFKSDNENYSFPFNQIGAVTSYRPIREADKGIISTHFGFTYTRVADFNSNTSINLGNNVKDIYNGGQITANTLLSAIMLEANGTAAGALKGRTKWAYDTYLIDLIDPIGDQYFTAYEGIDEENNEIFPRHIDGIKQVKQIESSGYQGEYGLTFGANISRIFLIGASLNFQTLKYSERNIFREINKNGLTPSYIEDLDYYDSYLNLDQDGFGINGKVGAIINLNPIRLGASFHFPTFYNIDETFHSGIEAYFLDKYRESSKSPTSEFNYSYRTPYRANGSLAFIMGKFALLSFDYEMTNHSSSQFSSNDNYHRHFDDLNQQISEQFKMTHDLRAGVEIKPVSYFSIRAGIAYFDSPLKKEYTNNIEASHISYSGGLGIRNKKFFFDIAYSLSNYERPYFINENGLYFEDAATLTSLTHQAAFTFGWKF